MSCEEVSGMDVAPLLAPLHISGHNLQVLQLKQLLDFVNGLNGCAENHAVKSRKLLCSQPCRPESRETLL